MVRLLLILGALLALLIPQSLHDHVPENEPLFVQEAEAFTGTFESGGIGKVTMYNSVPEQTDDTPFITASGETVRDGIVANNCLDFGTQVMIDGKVYEVQDRKNSRYGCEWFDIWSRSVDEALEYGVQEHQVSVVICMEDCPLIQNEENIDTGTE